MVVYSCNPSIREAEAVASSAGRRRQITSLRPARLHSETLSQKNQNKQTKKEQSSKKEKSTPKMKD
jgi:hypothetical protein